MENPMRENLRAFITSGNRETALLTLTDISGKMRSQKALLLNKGVNTIELYTTSTLAKGVYFLTVSTKKYTKQAKVLKQ